MGSTLQQLCDRDGATNALVQAGLAETLIDAKVSSFVMLATQLVDHGRSADAGAHVGFVPGRIEVLGKHTDYAGGRSIVGAAEQGFCAVGVPRDDTEVTLLDVGQHTSTRFTISPQLQPRHGHWSNYPMTVARRLARNFSTMRRGVDIAFASDLPPAAGMSSSSALMIMTYRQLEYANDLAETATYRSNIGNRLQLGEYLGTVENGQSYRRLEGDQGVGTFGGSEDHTAILASKSGCLGQFAYCPTRHERWINLSAEYVFAIAQSGVVAEKTGAAQHLYNRAARRATAITQLWQQVYGRDQRHLAAIVQSDPQAVDRVREMLRKHRHPEFDQAELRDRFEQFVAESEDIIPAVPDAIDAGTIDVFARQVARSQQLGAELLANQVPQTVSLARSATDLGAAAASAFGAGFGGSVWALVPVADAQRFLASWQHEYAAKFPIDASRASFFTTSAGGGER